MDWIPQIFRRRKFYEDLSEEIRLHIEERTEQLIHDGMSAEEATRAARRAFGNRTLLEERSREVWQWPTLESIWADVRFALRQLRKSPGFTITAVLTLTLAIGANAVVFGVLNALILRPLNVPQVESLFIVQHGSDVGPTLSGLSRSSPSAIAASTMWAAWAISRQGWTRAKIHPMSGNTKPAETTSDALRIQPYLAVSSTPSMSTAQTARLMSCSPTHIGAIFRMIAAWWAALFG